MDSLLDKMHLEGSSIGLARVISLLGLVAVLIGCGNSTVGQGPGREGAKQVAVETVKAYTRGDTEALKGLVAPLQRKDATANADALEKALIPHSTVSADTAILKGDYGRVVVKTEGPDIKDMASDLSMSEQMSFAAAVEKEKSSTVETKVNEMLESARNSAGKVPMTERRDRIPVVKNNAGDWKAVLPEMLEQKIIEGRRKLARGNVAEGDSVLRRAERLAPMKQETRNFRLQSTDRHLMIGRSELSEGDLSEAMEQLKIVVNQNEDLEAVRKFQEKVKREKKESVYASDSIRVEVKSAKASKNTRGFSEKVDIQASVKVENQGKESLDALRAEAVVDLSTKGPIQDTTVAVEGDITFRYPSGTVGLKGGKTGTFKFEGRGMRDANGVRGTEFSLESVKIMPRTTFFTRYRD
ncbi:hypothetical protein [Salinibacter ruber]|uniref:hypothetical protein n=1 Tax=Salinibacter ruber TaxID=146919 RepID=UPI0013C3213B|nr:hypothetical protein [Salinibacter ruber]